MGKDGTVWSDVTKGGGDPLDDIVGATQGATPATLLAFLRVVTHPQLLFVFSSQHWEILRPGQVSVSSQ